VHFLMIAVKHLDGVLKLLGAGAPRLNKDLKTRAVELRRLLEHWWESEQGTGAWKGCRDRLGAHAQPTQVQFEPGEPGDIRIGADPVSVVGLAADIRRVENELVAMEAQTEGSSEDLPQIFLFSTESRSGPGLFSDLARYWNLGGARGRLQLVGGSRPGSSWSLRLNLPVLTAAATKLFLVPAPATPTARPTCHQQQSAARLRCGSGLGLRPSNPRLPMCCNRASICRRPGQDQLRCRARRLRAGRGSEPRRRSRSLSSACMER
jgi:hypothetical protein